MRDPTATDKGHEAILTIENIQPNMSMDRTSFHIPAYLDQLLTLYADQLGQGKAKVLRNALLRELDRYRLELLQRKKLAEAQENNPQALAYNSFYNRPVEAHEARPTGEFPTISYEDMNPHAVDVESDEKFVKTLLLDFISVEDGLPQRWRPSRFLARSK